MVENDKHFVIRCSPKAMEEINKGVLAELLKESKWTRNKKDLLTMQD